ncbi:hypothetical protein BX666DRAFT_2011732 [Dichotomocladium elegans]|nr:hypothetical protein BX666DRAFT_2011732 [Dichotomocladium elegans]
MHIHHIIASKNQSIILFLPSIQAMWFSSWPLCFLSPPFLYYSNPTRYFLLPIGCCATVSSSLSTLSCFAG